MNYDINETDEQVEVKVSVPRDVKNKVVINTAKVKDYLSENNISFYDCVQESSINNRHSKWSGVWIFSKKRPTKPIQKPVEENVENVVDNDSANMIQSRSYSSSRRKKKKSYNKNIIENNDVE
tara:strand:- start:447 stop:815 length:369 start_codon:yes stop_codon:yes gene_type:complete